MLIVMLGPPGSGKGTQCKLLSQRLALPHFSTGEMLRDQIRRQTPLGIDAEPLLASGSFISDEIAIDLIRTRLPLPANTSHATRADFDGGLFDGFPRTLSQAISFDRILVERELAIDIVIEIQVPSTDLQARLSQRYRNSPYPRPEDSPAAIPRRMQIYRDETLPITAYYRQRRLLSSVDGTGSPEEVFATIAETVGRIR